MSGNTENQKPVQTPPPKANEREEPLDLEALDLSVEAVEERISPSETNVFDK